MWSKNDGIRSVGPSQPEIIGQLKLVCESLLACKKVVYAVG